MKTIAFLCTMISALLVTQDSVPMQSELDNSDDATITTESEKGELTIIYDGNTRFSTSIPTDDLTYHVNQTTTFNERIIVYGYTINRPLREHHAFMLFIDSDGQVIRHDVFDDAPLLEFITHFNLEDTLIFRMRESIDDDGTKEVKNHFVRYDETLTTYQVETIDSVIKVIDIIDEKLIMKAAYDTPYVYGLDSQLNHYEPETIYGVKDNDVFTGHVSLFTLNDATLNGEEFSQLTEITYPGYHHIKTTSNEATITVHPENDIIIENEIYDAPITIDGIKGRLLLNGQVIAPGETITEPGNYTLVIEGVNNYEKRIDFSVLSSIDGVYNNHVYDTKRTLTFNGTGYLNNVFIETGYTVNEPGLYTLDILGENDYRETIQFEIRSIEKSQSNNTLLYIEIGLLATIVVSTGILLIKYKVKA